MFKYYDSIDAEDGASDILKQAERQYGGKAPNLYRVMAESPAELQAYTVVMELFTQHTTFTPTEQQVVFMTANFDNNCHYCVPAHTHWMKLLKIEDSIIEDLRNGKDLADNKLRALQTFTKILMNKRGHVTEKELQNFFSAGYSEKQALEVIVGLSAKVLSNFTNAITNTELDEAFKPYYWELPEK